MGYRILGKIKMKMRMKGKYRLFKNSGMEHSAQGLARQKSL